MGLRTVHTKEGYLDLGWGRDVSDDNNDNRHLLLNRIHMQIHTYIIYIYTCILKKMAKNCGSGVTSANVSHISRNEEC